MKVDTDNQDTNLLRIQTANKYEYETADKAVAAFKELSKDRRNEFVHNFYMQLQEQDQQTIRMQMTDTEEAFNDLVDLTNNYIQEYRSRIIEPLIKERNEVQEQLKAHQQRIADNKAACADAAAQENQQPKPNANEDVDLM